MTDANVPAVPPASSGSEGPHASSGSIPLSEDARAQILTGEIARYAAKGWAVQTVAAGQAVLSRNKRMGWFWNLVLVVLTGGLWLIYVIYRALNRKKETLVISVDPSGKVRTA